MADFTVQVDVDFIPRCTLLKIEASFGKPFQRTLEVVGVEISKLARRLCLYEARQKCLVLLEEFVKRGGIGLVRGFCNVGRS